MHARPTQHADITHDQLDAAVARARQRPGRPGGLWLALLDELAMPEDLVTRALADLAGIAVLSDAQAASAQWRQPLAGVGWLVDCESQAFLLTEDPWSPAAWQALSRGRFGSAHLALARPGQTPPEPAVGALSASPAPDPTPPGDRAAVVDFVDHAIASAYGSGASDIHFETSRQGIAIKLRIDGVLSAGDRLGDATRAEEVISRIKVLAQLDITERRRPQDGRFRWEGAAGGVDLRVSIMPSIFGEDAVLRLLDKAQLRQPGQAMSLDALGFDSATCTRLRALARRPHGMLLVTGPTGSGKTTTVYASMSEANDGLQKIVTIEDPVEYELPGVLQIPVNERKGLTFATGLRSILRHDPDKILVGEIRDAETAEIAVQSALTGHLVFTTVHANSLFDVLGRFQHFGIDPFALASALNGVVVQRLLRRLCPHCAGWRAPRDDERASIEALNLASLARLPAPRGCGACRHTGYKGRMVLAEVHTLSDTVRDLMVAKAGMSELKSAVYAGAGAQRLHAVALDSVREAHTSLEEVTRVIGLA
ncbi:MAG: GspE/PulE family protein [Pseudomonadota bacterium]